MQPFSSVDQFLAAKAKNILVLRKFEKIENDWLYQLVAAINFLDVLRLKVQLGWPHSLLQLKKNGA